MNLIKIHILLALATIVIPQTLYSLSNGNNPALSVNATISKNDGTDIELNDIHINGGTELLVFAKSAKIEANGSSEVRLDTKPGDQVGPFQLATVKSITFKNPKTLYIYQEEKTGIKHSYVDIDIDGTAYLMRKDWSLKGMGAGNKPHTIDPSSVRSISIINACAKTAVPTEPCICPSPK